MTIESSAVAEFSRGPANISIATTPGEQKAVHALRTDGRAAEANVWTEIAEKKRNGGERCARQPTYQRMRASNSSNLLQ
eukprot:5303960-Prymnesium_polylepis.1